ncbi:LysR family transcriptional regulator [Cellulosimicrobium protaetiae]|uniref:LysR family transcriptional regulator n=1 Tax=Cellulosimicrobium protaetiae TaxID=2587808 RepID=A0A6M5UCS1_9MICO|nr:LysR family transcriptional regulator [Cellulosimicrobium protaetiae]QJW36316.1 LysR family transcriptional regulator [Cellulosimicrobium protaetiae]
MAQSSRDRTSLSALELLVATDSHGSISAAARALGVAQPTASAGLRALERRLGLDLLERTTRGARLTETGRATAAWAREVIEASDRFETSVAALRDAPSARVRVAASLTVAEYLAPRWLARLALEGPGPGGGAPDVELVVRNSREVTDLVLDGAVELGFVESATLRRGLRSRTVAHDRLVVVVGPAHRWARRSALRVDELLTGGLVVRERGSGTRETLERGLAAVGERLPDHLPYLGSTAALKTAVQHGGAVAVLSSLAVADDVARGALVRLPVPGLELDRRLRMVWKDGTALSSAARRIAAAAAASSG